MIRDMTRESGSVPDSVYVSYDQYSELNRELHNNVVTQGTGMCHLSYNGTQIIPVRDALSVDMGSARPKGIKLGGDVIDEEQEVKVSVI